MGGTGILGRHTVENFLAHEYDVTSLSRSHSEFPFSDPGAVEHVTGDRTDPSAFERIASRVGTSVSSVRGAGL